MENKSFHLLCVGYCSFRIEPASSFRFGQPASHMTLFPFCLDRERALRKSFFVFPHQRAMKKTLSPRIPLSRSFDFVHKNLSIGWPNGMSVYLLGLHKCLHFDLIYDPGRKLLCAKGAESYVRLYTQIERVVAKWKVKEKWDLFRFDLGLGFLKDKNEDLENKWRENGNTNRGKFHFSYRNGHRW